MTQRITIPSFFAAAALAAGPVWAAENLTALTSGPGHPVQDTIFHLADVARERDIADIQITTGQVATNILEAVATGRADIGICPFILPFLMDQGLGPYASMGAEKGAEMASKLSVLYPYSFGAYLLYNYDSSGVQGWSDLEGRKVLNGPPRGAATTNARSLIQLVTGLKDSEGDAQYSGVQVDWTQMSTTITSGGADAFVLPEVVPSGRMLQALAAGNMTFWSIPKDVFESEAMQRFLGAPGSVPLTFSVSAFSLAGEDATVVSEDDVFRTMGSAGGNCTNVDMSEDLAYQITKAHVETLDRLEKMAPYGTSVNYRVLDATASGMCGANPIKYHPGAIRAWEEFGYTVPDCAKP